MLKYVYMKRTKLSIIGLLQALGVAGYCFLISGFFQLMEKSASKPPVFMTAAFMLMLLVFSVAVIGLTVFGYPAYLALNQKLKEALSIVAFTLLYLLGIGAIILIILAV